MPDGRVGKLDLEAMMSKRMSKSYNARRIQGVVYKWKVVGMRGEELVWSSMGIHEARGSALALTRVPSRSW